jgi:FkbM family methyltransferase
LLILPKPQTGYRFFSKDMPMVIFDIGANVGLISQKFRDMYPSASIHAFEPTPEAFRRLSWRFRKEPSFAGNNIAISNEKTTATFHVNNEFNKVNSLLPRDRDMQVKHGLASVDQTIEVKTSTIDQYCAEKGITHINILKMDIQGGELMALHGAQKMLETLHIDLILTEVMFAKLYEGGPLFHDISDFLAERNYQLYNLYDLHRGNRGQLTWGDGIFSNQNFL